MFNFELKKTGIYQAVRWESFPIFKFAKVFKKIFIVLFIAAFLLFLYGFLQENFSNEICRNLFALSIIFIILFLFFWLSELFFNAKLKNPILKNSLKEAALKPEKYNLAEFLDFETARAVYKSLKFSNFSRTNSSHLLYFILTDNPRLNFIFFRSLLDINEIKEKIFEEIKRKKSKNSLVFDESFKNIILYALKRANDGNHTRIEMEDILSALSEIDPIFKKILISFDLKPEDIENLTWFLEEIEKKIEKRKKFWEYENLSRKGTLAKEWTSGYTVTLDRYSFDITETVKKYGPDIIGHKNEIELVERVLARREMNNALLVGDPGTGRKSIIQALAGRSLMGKSLPQLNYKRVVELDMPGLLAQIQDAEQVEAVLNRIFEESISAGNIILVINDIHNYIGQAPKPGVVDITGIIEPYLKSSLSLIVGITNYEGFHRNIEKNISILSQFEKVEVSGISPRETLLLLGSLIPQVEKKYKIFVSYPALRDIISLTNLYFPSLPFPEKALGIFDEVTVYVSTLAKEKIVLPKHVAKVITQKYKIPAGTLELKEKEILLQLEELIHQRIIDQEEAVGEISTALRRARSGITIRKGPIGAFLFLGPTGVGKTETAKALAEYYFGSEEKMIRLDMSEFQETKDIERLIGLSNTEGVLTNAVKENPFSLLLLDEFEKANSSVLNLFLQVFDEGYLTDGLSRKVSFKNIMIIATSNAAYKIILEAIKDKTEWGGVKQKILDELFKEGIFKPELINRFDGVVIFKPLSKENLLDIAELMLRALKKNLQEKGIEFLITEPLKEKIAELGYNPVFGAREMRRVVQDKVENVLASALLRGEIKKGNIVGINPDNFTLTLNIV